LPPFSVESIVEPIVVIVAVDNMLRIEGLTLTAAVVAVPFPFAPMQVIVYVTLPVPIGATLIVPAAGCVAVKVPPMLLEELRVQELALLEVHVNVTACPRLIVVGPAGAEKLTAGGGAGGGGGGIIGAP
jgi:hypothetical protein